MPNDSNEIRMCSLFEILQICRVNGQKTGSSKGNIFGQYGQVMILKKLNDSVAYVDSLKLAKEIGE